MHQSFPTKLRLGDQAKGVVTFLRGISQDPLSNGGQRITKNYFQEHHPSNFSYAAGLD